MEEGKRVLPNGSSSMAVEGLNITPAQLHALLAGVLQLAS
jgi:hypothetical protein